jgi:malate dehydrogenase
LSLALDKPANDISAMVGGHGDTTMIPLTRLASITESFSILSEEELQK